VPATEVNSSLPDTSNINSKLDAVMTQLDDSGLDDPVTIEGYTDPENPTQ
jgi:hypothetical protein